jgi:predicted metal-dependent phosphoesterase TrpH
MIVDLHCHSYYSDGDCSPEELLDIALTNQVNMLALTDHDCLDGYWHLERLAEGKPIRIIPGLECSVTWQRQELHVLGLNIDPEHPRLNRYLTAQAQRRWQRALQITALLQKIGIEGSLQGVMEIAGHQNISRTHYAKWLVNSHIVKDTASAFKQYLGSRACAYAPSQWASLEETIAVIKEAGGHAVLAHPMHYSLSTAGLKGLFKAFKTHGGEGIELISGLITMKDIEKIKKLVHLFDFKVSTGSDFHRKQIYRASLGKQTSVPDDMLPIWQDW